VSATGRAASAVLLATALAACGTGALPRSPATPPRAPTGPFQVSSPQLLSANRTFPRDLTCDGADRAPRVRWTAEPAGTVELALEVYDVDAPAGRFTHWLVYDLPATGVELSPPVPSPAVEGINDFGKQGWGGPCPPPGSPHRYVFQLSALDARLGLPAGARANALEAATRGHVIGTATFVATYRR
jgi:Raf kinase inhibitor-like YbhB/YbcL family protein